MDTAPAAPEEIQHSVFTPTDAEMAAHPQPIYRMMREFAPVIETDDGGIMVTRHEDVMDALRNPEVFSSDMDAIAWATSARSSRCRSTRPTTSSSARSSTRCSRHAKSRASTTRCARSRTR